MANGWYRRKGSEDPLRELPGGISHNLTAAIAYLGGWNAYAIEQGFGHRLSEDLAGRRRVYRKLGGNPVHARLQGRYGRLDGAHGRLHSSDGIGDWREVFGLGWTEALYGCEDLTVLGRDGGQGLV